MANFGDTVTIEGTLMPAAGVLATGEQRDVPYTDWVARLVAGGFVKIINVYEPDELEEAQEPSGEDFGPEGQTPLPVGDGEAAQAGELEEPSGNADLEAWRAFFAANNIEYSEDHGRNTLRDAWYAIKQQREGGS